jgi:hypothetical protein
MSKVNSGKKSTGEQEVIGEIRQVPIDKITSY